MQNRDAWYGKLVARNFGFRHGAHDCDAQLTRGLLQPGLQIGGVAVYRYKEGALDELLVCGVELFLGGENLCVFQAIA